MSWGKGKFAATFLLMAFAITLFLFSPKANAAENHLVINEVFSAPKTGEKEWVEIFNPTVDDIDLNDFSLKDGSVAAKNLSGTISAGEYFVYESSSGWLNNSGETISLIYKPTATTIDQIIYGDWNDDQDSQPPAPTSDKSLSRIPNGSDSDDYLVDFRTLPLTKESENLLPTYSDKIIINEILPQPTTSTKDEFIELFNGESVDVDISGWQLDDLFNSGSSPYTIPPDTVIPALSYLLFYNPDTGISLNDTGDTVRLIDPNSEEKAKVIYTSTKRGQTFSLFGESWQWTISPTPNLTNIFKIESENESSEIQIIETDINGARELKDETLVSITGIATVVPGKLSSQYFYIQDSGSGIQIYNYGKEFPALNIGDEVRVTGELDTISNERRIKTASINDIKILASRPPPEPAQIKIDDINENLEGQYIEVIGIVSKSSGNTFYIHGSGEIQIAIRSGTGIKKPRMKVGDKVKIAGILSQYNDNFRILPTRQEDVKIISSSKLADTGPSIWFCLALALLLTTITWITQAKAQKKQRNWPKNLSQIIQH